MNAGSSGDGERAPGRRLFFALWPDAALRKRLELTVLRALPARAGRPVPPENLHLTLVFLGHVSEARYACVERVAEETRGAPFELVLDRIAWWRQPQVLWLGARETPPVLGRLVSALRERLETSCGLAPDARPFRAHMTLMRKVRRRPPALRFDPGRDPLVWRPDGCALVESTTLPDGVRYRRCAFRPFE